MVARTRFIRTAPRRRAQRHCAPQAAGRHLAALALLAALAWPGPAAAGRDAGVSAEPASPSGPDAGHAAKRHHHHRADAGVPEAEAAATVVPASDARTATADAADAGVDDAGVEDTSIHAPPYAAAGEPEAPPPTVTATDAGAATDASAANGLNGAHAANGIDAALAPDATESVDAGVAVDAGPDAGLDAGLVDAGLVDAGAFPARIFTPPTDAVPAAPALDAHDRAQLHETGARTWLAIKVILGLVLLAALAYLGGNRRVVRLQERLGISNVIAAGLPFVGLGLFASHPSVGILTGDVLGRMRPILEFGLGWLGFIIGAQLDIRVLDRVPRGTAYLMLVEALAPFAVTAAACGAVMLTFGASLRDGAVWRDLVLLGSAAAMTAPRRFRGFANRTWRQGKGVDLLLAQLDEIVGVIGLLFLTAYFRGDTSGTWQLPDTAWLFVSLGLGVTLGILIFAMVRVPVSNAEFLAVVLGSVSFASGLAGYLGLSPIVICFIAGALVVNFPCEQRGSVFRILNHLERPIHLLFLVIAGAVWSVSDWRGWILVPLFVAARAIGKWLGMLGAEATVGADLPAGFADRRTLISPLSSLSIALVVSVESLHRAPTLAWITTAVIGGAFLIELVVQFVPETGGDMARPIGDDTSPVPRVGLDELDDTGPVEQPPTPVEEQSRPPMESRARTTLPIDIPEDEP